MNEIAISNAPTPEFVTSEPSTPVFEETELISMLGLVPQPVAVLDWDDDLPELQDTKPTVVDDLFAQFEFVDVPFLEPPKPFVDADFNFEKSLDEYAQQLLTENDIQLTMDLIASQ